jgi:hypothetical protein
VRAGAPGGFFTGCHGALGESPDFTRAPCRKLRHGESWLARQRLPGEPGSALIPCELPTTRGLDRDACAQAVRCVGGFVVEPYPALGEVTEVQCAASLDSHRRATNAVCSLLQWMGEGVPVIEITHHGYGPAGLVDWQCEGDANIALTPGLGCLDQLLSPLRR